MAQAAAMSAKAACAFAAIGLVLCGCASQATRRAQFLEQGKALLAAKDAPRAVLQLRNAVRLGPQDAEAHYQLGRAYREAGSLPLAYGEFTRAVELEPKHTGARVQVAEIMAASEDPESQQEAREHARTTLEQAPGDPDALTALAIAELRLGRKDEARNDLLQALRAAPAHLKSAALLAGLYLARNDAAAAEKVLSDVARQEPANAASLIALARFYRMRGRDAEAEPLLDRAVRLDPAGGAALIDLAAIQLRSGRKQAAERSYRLAAKTGARGYRQAHVLFLIQDGRLAEATEEAARLAGADRADREMRTLLLHCYGAAGRTADAERLLAADLSRNPADIEALVERARMRVSAERWKEAEEDLISVLRLKPVSAEAHFLAARVQQSKGSEAGYRRELEECLRYEPAMLPARLELAAALMQARDYRAALELLNGATAVQKSGVAFRVQRNAALLGMSRWEEAAAGIRAGLALQRNSDFLIQDGLLRIERREYDAARRDFEEVLSGNPEQLRALDLLVGLCRLQGQPGAAGPLVDGYLAKKPGSAALLGYRGRMLLAEGRSGAARAMLEAAVQASPRDRSAMLALVRLDVTDGRLDEARRRVAGLRAEDADATVWNALALIEERAGNWRQAVEWYGRAVQRDAKSVLALNNLAALLAEHGRVDEAMQYAQRAADLAPGDGAVQDTLGWICYSKGLYSTAVGYLERAVAASPTPVRKLHLAQAYAKLRAPATAP